MTIAGALREAARSLAPVSDTARLDAEVLMAHALGTSRSDVLLHRMEDAAPATFAALIARRRLSEPVAYILGQQEFYGLMLEVSPAVLIPRADSETLIEAAREAVGARVPGRVCDLGTGSGALLLAALSLWPGAQGVGLDRSAAALEVARRNAHTRAPAADIRFVRRDWHKPGWAGDLGRFDLVLCNPPYVEEGAALDPQVRAFEPAGALFAGPQGLDDYRALVPQLRALLAPGGIAVLEIGAGQAGQVGAIALACGFEPPADGGPGSWIRRDLAGRPRALVLR